MAAPSNARIRRLLRGPSWGGTQLQNLVVLAEDDKTLRENLSFLLKAERIPAMAAKDGLEVAALVRRHRPKVVILDMYLPHASGFEVLEEFRRDPILEHIFVIAVTGMARDDEDLRDMRDGADVILSKPYDENRLLRLIRSAFEYADDASGLRRHLGGL